MSHVHLECHYCGESFDFSADREVSPSHPARLEFSREFKVHVFHCREIYWKIVQSVVGVRELPYQKGLNEAGLYYMGSSK